MYVNVFVWWWTNPIESINISFCSVLLMLKNKTSIWKVESRVSVKWIPYAGTYVSGQIDHNWKYPSIQTFNKTYKFLSLAHVVVFLRSHRLILTVYYGNYEWHFSQLSLSWTTWVFILTGQIVGTPVAQNLISDYI